MWGGSADDKSQGSQSTQSGKGTYRGSKGSQYVSKNRAYSSQSVMTRGISTKPKPQSSRARVGQSTKAMITKLAFNNLLSLGMKAENAARRVGVKLSPGRKLKTKDLMDLKMRGEIKPKKRM